MRGYILPIGWNERRRNPHHPRNPTAIAGNVLLSSQWTLSQVGTAVGGSSTGPGSAQVNRIDVLLRGADAAVAFIAASAPAEVQRCVQALTGIPTVVTGGNGTSAAGVTSYDVVQASPAAFLSGQNAPAAPTSWVARPILTSTIAALQGGVSTDPANPLFDVSMDYDRDLTLIAPNSASYATGHAELNRRIAVAAAKGTGKLIQMNQRSPLALDVLVLTMSEQPYQGDALMTVAVDGVQLGGTYTVTAVHGTATQDFTFYGAWGPGPHTVTVTFLNDAYGGNADADRNLWWDKATFNGRQYAPAQVIGGSGEQFSLTVQSNQDVLTLRMSGTSYSPTNGPDASPQFSFTVDGVSFGPYLVLPTVYYWDGQYQDFTVQGSFGPGPHDIAVSFTNDFSDAGGDRNLVWISSTLNGRFYRTAKSGVTYTEPALKVQNGDLFFLQNGTATVTVGTPQSALPAMVPVIDAAWASETHAAPASDVTASGVTWRANSATQTAYRLASRIARIAWDKNWTTAGANLSTLPNSGPTMASAVRTGADQLTITVTHNKGTDLVVPPRVRADAFSVVSGTSTIYGTAVQRLTETTLLVTFGANLKQAAGSLYYCLEPDFVGEGRAVTDNWHTSAVAKPSSIATVSGINTTTWPLQRNATPIAIPDTGQPEPTPDPDPVPNPDPTPNPTPGTFPLTIGYAIPFQQLHPSEGRSQAQYIQDMNDIRDSGAQHIRMDFRQNRIDPNDTKSWNFDPLLEFNDRCRERGLKIVGCIHDNNNASWARGGLNSEVSRQRFAEFAAAVVARFKGTQVIAWEIGNEVNDAGNFGNQASMPDYCDLMRRCYPLMKAADANTPVITGGPSGAGQSSPNTQIGASDWYEGLYTYGAKGYFDMIGTHPYSWPNSPYYIGGYNPTSGQRYAGNGPWNAWAFMQYDCRNAMIRNGDGAKKCFATEYGDPSSASGEARQAQNITDAAAIARNGGQLPSGADKDWLVGISYYTWRDFPEISGTEGTFGVLRPDRSRKPAWQALKNAVS